MRTYSASPTESLNLDIDVHLAEDFAAVPGVRHRVGAALADLDPDDRDAVLLVCDELVTNAFEHGRSPRRFMLCRHPAAVALTAAWRCPDWLVLIAVQDASTDPPVPHVSRLGASRGHGLVLIDRLARDWGTTHRGEHGKTVWAQVLCGSAATSRAHDAPEYAEPARTVKLAG